MFEQVNPTAPAVQGATTKDALTHSRLSCFRDCPRKHYLRYELGLRKDEDGFARKFGSALHYCLEMTDRGLEIQDDELGLEDPYDQAMLAAVFRAHIERYSEAEDQLEVVAAEQEFEIPLINPETGRPTPTFVLRGKIDRIVRLRDGRLALGEYKTTSRDFSPGAEYWQNLHMDPQLSIYVIAAREMGYPIETVLYDVTRRPALRPYKATPEENRKYKKDGTLYANQREEDETPEAYMARITADIAERPEHYFSRIEIARLDQDLDDCRADLWQQQLAVRAAQKSGHWYKNPNSCYGIFSCDFLPVCQNRDLETVTPQGFVRLEDVHPELGNAPVEG